MKNMLVYVDTSVFGGVFDPQFEGIYLPKGSGRKIRNTLAACRCPSLSKPRHDVGVGCHGTTLKNHV
jgi:hypothetical protein